MCSVFCRALEILCGSWLLALSALAKSSDDIKKHQKTHFLSAAFSPSLGDWPRHRSYGVVKKD
jgi:hypothetical protein